MAHEVTITFILTEEVTPAIFGNKVAEVLAANGVLREGERAYIYWTGEGHEIKVVRTGEVKAHPASRFMGWDVEKGQATFTKREQQGNTP